MQLKRNILSILYSLGFLVLLGVGFCGIMYLAIASTENRNVVASIIILGIVIYLIVAFLLKENGALQLVQSGGQLFRILEVFCVAAACAGVFVLHLGGGVENDAMLTVLVVLLYGCARLLGGRLCGMAAVCMGFFLSMSLSGVVSSMDRYLDILCILIPYFVFLLITKKLTLTFIEQGFFLFSAYLLLAVLFSLAAIVNPLVCVLLAGCVLSLAFGKTEGQGGIMTKGIFSAFVLLFLVLVILAGVYVLMPELCTMPDMAPDDALIQAVPDYEDVGKFLLRKYIRLIKVLFTASQAGIFPAIVFFFAAVSGYYSIRNKASEIAPLCLAFFSIAAYYLVFGTAENGFYPMLYLTAIFAAYGIYNTLLPEELPEVREGGEEVSDAAGEEEGEQGIQLGHGSRQEGQSQGDFGSGQEPATRLEGNTARDPHGQREVDPPQDLYGQQEAGSPQDLYGRQEAGSSQDLYDRQEAGSPQDLYGRQEAGSPQDLHGRQEAGSPQDLHGRQEAGSPQDLYGRQEMGSPQDLHGRQEAGSPQDLYGQQEAGSPQDLYDRQEAVDQSEPDVPSEQEEPSDDRIFSDSAEEELYVSTKKRRNDRGETESAVISIQNMNADAAPEWTVSENYVQQKKVVEKVAEESVKKASEQPSSSPAPDEATEEIFQQPEAVEAVDNVTISGSLAGDDGDFFSEGTDHTTIGSGVEVEQGDEGAAEISLSGIRSMEEESGIMNTVEENVKLSEEQLSSQDKIDVVATQIDGGADFDNSADAQLNNLLDRLDISDNIRRMNESAREDMADIIERDDSVNELFEAKPAEQIDFEPAGVVELEPALEPSMGSGLAVELEPALEPSMGSGLAVELEPALEPSMESGLAVELEPVLEPSMGSGLAVELEPALEPSMGLELGQEPGVAVEQEPMLELSQEPEYMPEPTMEPELATEPEPIVELALEPSLESGLTVELEPSLESSMELEPALEPELAVEPGFMPEWDQEPELAINPELIAEPAVGLSLEPELAVEPDLTPEPIMEPELAVEPEPILEQGQELELAVEPEPILEQGQELELAVEPEPILEQGQELELAVEPESLLEPEITVNVEPQSHLERQTELEPDQNLDLLPDSDPQLSFAPQMDIGLSLEDEMAGSESIKKNQAARRTLPKYVKPDYGFSMEPISQPSAGMSQEIGEYDKVPTINDLERKWRNLNEAGESEYAYTKESEEIEKRRENIETTNQETGRYREGDKTASQETGRYREGDKTASQETGRYREGDKTASQETERYREGGKTASQETGRYREGGKTTSQETGKYREGGKTASQETERYQESHVTVSQKAEKIVHSEEIVRMTSKGKRSYHRITIN